MLDRPTRTELLLLLMAAPVTAQPDVSTPPLARSWTAPGPVTKQIPGNFLGQRQVDSLHLDGGALVMTADPMLFHSFTTVDFGPSNSSIQDFAKLGAEDGPGRFVLVDQGGLSIGSRWVRTREPRGDTGIDGDPSPPFCDDEPPVPPGA